MLAHHGVGLAGVRAADIISVLLTALTLACNVPAARAEDVAVEVLWQACPYLLGTAASVALKRLQLPPDDVEAIAEVTCQVAQAYQDLDANLPPVPPDDPRTVEEIFCEGSYLGACAVRDDRGGTMALMIRPEMYVHYR